jgi:CBS domain-containing protein
MSFDECMEIKKVMTKKLITLSPTDTLEEVVAKFVTHNISGAPVVDKDLQLIGILTESDILKALESKYTQKKMVIPFLSAQSPLLGLRFEDIPTMKEVKKAFDNIKSTSVSEMMKTTVISASPKDSVEDAAKVMLNKRINRIPIVEKKKAVGIITRGDVLKAIYNLEA